MKPGWPSHAPRPLAGPAPHPGEMLKDELEARGLSAHALSIALRLPAARISQIVRGQRAITPETALRLARYFGGSAAIWLRLKSPTTCPAPKPNSPPKSPRPLRDTR
jgi:addiction module HigA family antidote